MKPVVDNDREASPAKPPPLFPTTHWSVVSKAGTRESPRAAGALETLCRAYWSPIYAFVRRRGSAPHEAQDLTQGFFARLLEKEYLAAADPAKGKFRTFLLTALKCYLADEYDKASAKKRGQGKPPLSIDQQPAEHRYGLEPSDEVSPAQVFERQWAMTLLERTRDRLRQEYAAAGRTVVFEQLRSFHGVDETTVAYAEVAQRLGTPVNTVKSHVLRLRRRYRQLLREEVAHTVSDPAEIDGEIRYLLEVVSR